MSENAWLEWAKPINEMTESLENNADALTNRIRKATQEKLLANGEITQEEAFAEDVQFAQGEMLSEYCTYCGAPIRLHSKINTIVCRTCGHQVDRADAKNGKYEKTALAQMDADLIYQLSSQKKTRKNELLNAAAAKGNIKANRELALKYVLDEDYDTARPYAEFGKKHGDADSACCLLACQVCTKKPDDANDGLTVLHGINQSALTENGKKLYALLEDALEEYAQEQREYQRNLAAARAAAEHAAIADAAYRRMTEPQLESTIWSDWRNGEQLYRRSTDGKIVNGAGEEVSVAWWD